MTNGHGTRVVARDEAYEGRTRKLGPSAEIAQKKIEILATMTVIAIDVEHVVKAIRPDTRAC